MTPVPNPGPAEPAALRVDLDSAAAHRPILGTGFNFEHALWSCPGFRGLFRSEFLDPFQPALARVDTGLLPAAPPELPASRLGSAVYASVLASEPYADSWRFLRRLNRANVHVNQGSDPIDLALSLQAAEAARYPALVVTRTSRGHHAERLGRVRDGSGGLTLPPRSLTTLLPAGQGPAQDDGEDVP